MDKALSISSHAMPALFLSRLNVGNWIAMTAMMIMSKIVIPILAFMNMLHISAIANTVSATANTLRHTLYIFCRASSD